ncbi:MAG: amidohydrolase family protein [Bryobacteraceae bacterium]
MNRRQLMMASGAALAMRPGSAQSQGTAAQDLPDRILLKDYRPRSIYKIPVTEVKKAKFPIVDVHCHGARGTEQLDEMVGTMDAVGVEKTVIFTGAATGEKFAEARRRYSKYPSRFDLWCGFDMTGGETPGFGPAAVKALEECHRLGALGVGEISDKGKGIGVRVGTGLGLFPGSSNRPLPQSPAAGPHPDDSRMDTLFDKCAKLGLPVNIHMSDPIWAYEPMDKTNDGLMNAFTWRLDDKPGLMGHDGLIESLEAAVQKHPKTIFIACHLANLDYDLTRLGRMFDRNPNLYADIAARFAETAPIPKFAAQFFERYSSRILYGTDMAYNRRMFGATFRILETNDEHFYENDLNFNFNYHWALNGFGLPDPVLRKLYGGNAKDVFQQARNNAG